MNMKLINLFVLFYSCGVLLSVTNSQENKDIIEMSIDSDGTQHIINESEEQPEEGGNLAVGIRVKNPRNELIDYYWDNGVDRIFQGFIKPYGVTATNSYVGHSFVFTKHDQPDSILHSIRVTSRSNIYILPPDDVNNTHYKQFLEEKRFCEDYQKRTGRPWLAHYPRNPPVLYMWPAEYVGQKHVITSSESYWKCIPNSKTPSASEISECRTPGNINLTLEVVSLKPKIFRIDNTISDAEADLIIALSKPKIKRSLAGTDGGLVTNTRTSSNTWLGRSEHYVLDTIYRRASHLLNIDDKLFQPGTENNVVEDLQVVNYKKGQEYAPHHDFGADGRPEQRYITLIFYLNNLSSEDGGETGFPKANNGKGFKLHAGKGNSAMFYSLLEDGNADDLSLHAGTPVKRGEKWICNFWIWDPKRAF